MDWTQLLLFAILGLGAGSLIAGIALGVVLTYRGSGIINLATGAIAMLAGYSYWALRSGEFGGWHAPTAVALLITFLVMIGIGVLIEFAAFRPLRTASPLAKLAASLGVLLVAQAAVSLAFGIGTQPQPTVLPTDTVKLLGAIVPVDRLILPAIVLVATLALSLFFKFSRFGLATRAASENEVGAMLIGLAPNQLALINTVAATIVAGALGVLAASITQLDSTALPLQVVPALTAALFANFTSFWIAALVGLSIGMLENILYYLQTFSWFPTDHGVAMPGIQPLLVFILMVIAMFIRGTRLPSRGELVEQRLPFAPRARRLWPPALIGAGGAVIALIVLPYDFRQALITSLLATIMCLSLVVITGFVGQISIVQLALAGIAGFILSHLAVDHGIGFPLGMLIGSLGATVCGLVIAVSALRVRGVSLAVVTLGAAVAIEQFVFLSTTWGGGSSSSPVPAPKVFGLDLSPYGGFRGLDGKIPSPVFGFFVVAITARPGALRGQPAPVEPRTADARRPLQRARGCRNRCERHDREAGRVRDQLVHRRDRRDPVRLQLQLGHGHTVLRAHRIEPHRVRVRRRHHDGCGRDLRRPHLRRGALPLCTREVVRRRGKLGAPRGRARADRDARPEPRGRRRRHLPEAAVETEAAGAGRPELRPARHHGRGALMERVLTTHTGSLIRPPELLDLAASIDDAQAARPGSLRAGTRARRHGRGRAPGRGGHRRRGRRRDGQGELDHVPLRADPRDRAAARADRGGRHPASEQRPAGVPGVLR